MQLVQCNVDKLGRVNISYLFVKVRAIMIMAKKSPGMGTMVEGDGTSAMLLGCACMPW